MYSKKPRQFLPIKQSYLGVLIGYMVAQLPNNGKDHPSEQI
jgi:hypothetical protein